MSNKFLLIIIGISLISIIYATGMPDPYGNYDNDGILNKDDNCYYVYNPFQLDNDRDGWGNCCDADYAKPEGIIWCDDPKQNQEEPPVFCGDGICNGDENCTTCPEDCGVCPEEPENETDQIQNQGSHKIYFTQFCEPNWKCSGWSACENSLMTRTCYDSNYCDYFYNKPIEETGCEIPSKVFIEENKFNYSFVLFGSLITLALIVTLIIIVARRKK